MIRTSAGRLPVRLCLVAARAAFERDADWLASLERVAHAIANRPRIPAVLQVRVTDAALANAALAAWRRVDPERRVPALLNAPGLDAAALGFDGVHWREALIPEAPSARPGPGWIASASVHSEPALRRAEHAGADFALFGPVWAPSWKPSLPVGLEALRALVDAARIPVLALGGVTPERARACLEQGAAGVAVVSSLFHAPDPATALDDYLEALGLVST